MAEQVRAEISDGIAQIVLCAPQSGNQIDVDFVGSLHRVLDVVEPDETVRAVLIRAEGEHFSYGGNMRAFHACLDDLPAAIMALFEGFNPMLERVEALPVPVVAQVQGWCVGGALGMAALADILVAGEGARFRASFPGLGISNAAGSTVSFSARMGVQAAKRFCLLNEPMDALQAKESGLVDMVLPDADLDREALALATWLAAGPTLSYRGMRRNFGRYAGMAYGEVLRMEAESLRVCSESADVAEAVRAFIEKRRPTMTGQ
ncbi:MULTISPECIES: enoyl-CoA hydratase/isomerase family protein [unclassified Luteococcus]|uniref:enoyl-CoA hydratase/isomerase family protein n=1 Tax=unclassified Luteococcus TaxID=2639923 RepID=UPI00313B784B